METDEGVLNVYDDEEKKTRKRRREAEIVPAKHATRNSKKVKHKKEPITVKEPKLKKGKAVHVSSRMSSSAPKCRTSVRMSKSEGEIRPSDAVQTKGKRSSPLVELVCFDSIHHHFHKIKSCRCLPTHLLGTFSAW